MNEKQWWWPVETNDDWVNGIKADYPEDTDGMCENDIRDEYANNLKYQITWDHIGDAYEQFEKLADDWHRLKKKCGE